MESWCFFKHKSSLLTFMMLLIFMFGWTQGISIEDERKALLEIKASLYKVSNFFNADNLLPTWVDQGSKYCDWERIKCETISGYVTDLSLGNMFSMDTEDIYTLYNRYYFNLGGMIWPLNASLFLHFKELRRLDLSLSYIGNTFVSTGLERLSELKKLENMNLSFNFIETNIFPSLSELTSLKILDLSYIIGDQGYLPTHDISEFRVPANMEVLDVTGNNYYGTLEIQGSHGTSTLSKMKILNLAYNQFNKSLVTSLSALTSLESLDLSGIGLYGLFPSQEISHLTNLEKLDLSRNYLNVTPSVQDCMSLMRLERLESVSLASNNFNKSFISCLSFLPSLKILDLSGSFSLGSSFPMQELSSLRELKTLDMTYCGLDSLPLNGTMSNLQHLTLDDNSFSLEADIMSSMAAFPSLRFLSLAHCSIGGRLFANEVPNLPYLEVLILGGNSFNGTLPMEALASFHRLKVLDLSYNNFVGSIPSTIKSLSSLQAVSFAYNSLNGSLTNDGFCDLKNLLELDLCHNMFAGNLPNCFSGLSSLKLFDISSNQFTGGIPPSLIVNLTSLEYVDFSLNVFEGSFSFSLFSNHTKLQFFQFKRGGEKIQVETEEPIGWIPMFQLKGLVLSNCIIKGSVVPSFLLHQHDLRVLDLSHNSIEGKLPNWLLNNKTKFNKLDMSGNHITGTIPQNIQNSIPKVVHLNFSSNALNGVIPTSMSDLIFLRILDLSNNKLSGEVPKGLFTNISNLYRIKLSNNTLSGHVLSGNLSWLGHLKTIQLDDNCFTGNIGNNTSEDMGPTVLDISDNQFTGRIPSWISNMCPSDFYICELVARNNHLEGQFPCGNTSFSFLDISHNSFSGPIPSCINLKYTRHLHLGSNRFTGLVPDAFRNLTNVLTLDISRNYLLGRLPEFLGELSNLRILLLGKNKFIGSIPEKLCQLNNVSLIDISSNSLTGSIPRCLKNITGPNQLAFVEELTYSYSVYYSGLLEYDSVLKHSDRITYSRLFETRDEAQFTTKNNLLTYKGNILDNMSGLDLSCNKLTGAIPWELGFLTHILDLNLSHNKLSGPIPLSFSNLSKIESLDLSSNRLSGKVPSELIKLTSLEVFNVAYNNLSGRLPELKAQFATFSKESYEGNPLLCGPPLENNCTTTPQVSESSTKEDTEKWYDIDMTSFYGSSCSTWFVFMLGFVAVLYINPYWRRRWLEFVEDCMYTCYYFLYDFVRYLYKLIRD